MNLVTSWLLYTGSGRISRFGTSRLLGIFLSSQLSAISSQPHCPQLLRAASCELIARLGFLRALGAVLGAALVPLGNADGVERSTDDVITNTRKIFDTAPADEHDRVLLEVVTDTRDVGGDFDSVGETDTGDLAERRVRLLRRRGIDARANAALLRTRLERRRLRLVLDARRGRCATS